MSAVLPVRVAGSVLRAAAATDAPAIVALLADDELGAERDGIRHNTDLRQYRDAFAVIDADPAHLLLVAEHVGEVVGSLQLSFLPGLARRGTLRAQIEAVRVRPDRRGRGLGAAMIGWAIGEARRRECALVQLSTGRSRADAHRFYERLGFVASHKGFKLDLGHP